MKVSQEKITLTELERCPECGALGRIDQEQLEGKVSIRCSECGHHYYKGEKSR